MKPGDNGPACRVEIHAGGREVVVEADGKLPDVARKALDLWRATGRATPRRAGDAATSVGFGVTDRADRPGLMPAELDLPTRIADREEGDDVDRHRRTGF